ncbi:Notch-regulated ankyrin repeat-containing protein [Striga asiatica]|uniref:Notch-regulated ankyrin repeat-containing protein n=1 Tax=Striga asiatica TaxID=4170 RepID=A0A5A7Q3Z6_STRAF|nr:Notch-regulated ankyrin repeat-containing protein [Striga asiatica]
MHGRDATLLNNTGTTNLHTTILEENLESVNVVEKGADFNRANMHGWTTQVCVRGYDIWTQHRTSSHGREARWRLWRGTPSAEKDHVPFVSKKDIHAGEPEGDVLIFMTGQFINTK